MDPQLAVDLGREAISTALILVAPFLLVGLGLSLALGLAQSMTQIHDQTVSYIPKILLMIAALGLGLPWVSSRMMEYSRQQFEKPVLMSISETRSPQSK